MPKYCFIMHWDYLITFKSFLIKWNLYDLCSWVVKESLYYVISYQNLVLQRSSSWVLFEFLMVINSFVFFHPNCIDCNIFTHIVHMAMNNVLYSIFHLTEDSYCLRLNEVIWLVQLFGYVYDWPICFICDAADPTCCIVDLDCIVIKIDPVWFNHEWGAKVSVFNFLSLISQL